LMVILDLANSCDTFEPISPLSCHNDSMEDHR
jgi:hypothetical protein